jgi:hypothetical protein
MSEKIPHRDQLREQRNPNWQVLVGGDDDCDEQKLNKTKRPSRTDSFTNERVIKMSSVGKDMSKVEIPADFESIKTNHKKDEDFRIYDQTTTPQRVVDHYRNMRTYQTVDFYRKMEQKYDFSNGNYRRLMTIEEALVELENYVDSSDPDLDLPNTLHLLQTAEGIRQAGHPGRFHFIFCDQFKLSGACSLTFLLIKHRLDAAYRLAP